MHPPAHAPSPFIFRRIASAVSSLSYSGLTRRLNHTNAYIHIPSPRTHNFLRLFFPLCLLLSLTSWVQVCKRQVYFLFVFLTCSKFSLVAQKRTPDLLTQSLDTIFALARTGLNVADPRTHDAAYDHLERAVVILRIGEDVDSKPSESGSADIPNYARCVLGAFHNLAGTLYQGGKHGLAVRFLKQGCALGVKARIMHHVGGMSEDGGVEIVERAALL